MINHIITMSSGIISRRIAHIATILVQSSHSNPQQGKRYTTWRESRFFNFIHLGCFGSPFFFIYHSVAKFLDIYCCFPEKVCKFATSIVLLRWLYSSAIQWFIRGCIFDLREITTGNQQIPSNFGIENEVNLNRYRNEWS